MSIPHLRDRLVKIISDYNLEVSLRSGCNVILKSDCVSLFDGLLRERVKPCRVTSRTLCVSCATPLLTGRQKDALAVFSCGHAFHKKCLSAAASQCIRIYFQQVTLLNFFEITFDDLFQFVLSPSLQ